jgi:hypothetical protein
MLIEVKFNEDLAMIDRRYAIGSMVNGSFVPFFNGNKYQGDAPKKLTARLFRANVPNGNNRVYTTKTLEALVKKNPSGLGSFCLTDRAFSRWNNFGGERCEEPSHRYSNLRIEDGYLVADIEILDNENGSELYNLISKKGFCYVDFRTGCDIACDDLKDGVVNVLDDPNCVLRDIAVMKSDNAAKLIKE